MRGGAGGIGLGGIIVIVGILADALLVVLARVDHHSHRPHRLRRLRPRPLVLEVGLLDRIGQLVRAWVHRLLSGAEDPAVTLDYSYERQRQLLQNVKRGVADVVTAKKRLQLQAERLGQSVGKLEGRRGRRSAPGREDLARAALERKALAQQQLAGLDEQVRQLETQQERLVQSEQRLAGRVEAFRSQKEVMKAQYSAAEAQVRIGEAATGIGEEMADTGLAIERARDRTEQMTARAAALDELVESGTLEDLTAPSDALDRELARLDAGQQVDADLERLRAELGGGASRSELPPPA